MLNSKDIGTIFFPTEAANEPEPKTDGYTKAICFLAGLSVSQALTTLIIILTK
jgi:hypothetical protein